MYLYDNKKLEQKKLFIDTNNFNKPILDNLYDLLSKKSALYRYIPPSNIINHFNMSFISNLTNCIDGEFHNFISYEKTLRCSKCHEYIDPDKFVPESVELLKKRNIYIYLKKLAKKYCITGEIHQFEYNSKLDINKCKKCKYIYGNSIQYNDKQLKEMYKVISDNIIKNNLKINENIYNKKIKK